MDRETLAAALDQLWDELPQLIGADWPEIRARLSAYREQLLDPETGPNAQVQMTRLLAGYPAAWVRISQPAPSGEKGLHPPSEPADAESLEFSAHTGGGAMVSGNVQVSGDFIGRDQIVYPPAPAPRTIRYTDVACPGRIWVQEERFTVVARLTHLPRSRDEYLVKPVELDGIAPVFVQLNAPNFTLLTPNRRPLILHPTEDSEVSFDLSPTEPGSHPIDVEYWQNGVQVAIVRITVAVAESVITGGAARATARPVCFDDGAEPPDLLLQITLGWVEGQHRLIFALFDADKAGGQDLGFVPLTADPQRYAQRLFSRLTSQARTLDDLDPEQIAVHEKKLRRIGEQLWYDLTPEALKTLYRSDAQTWAGKSMLLVTDEPYIPWELVWPYFPDERRADDAPWGVTLRLIRWLRTNGRDLGYSGPSSRLHLSPMACIAPDVDLPMARTEEEMMQNVMRQHVLSDVSPSAITYESVMTLLEEGEYAWLHIVSHDDFDRDDPDGGACVDLGDDVLCADDVCGLEIEAHLQRARPGIVLNMCHSGRQGWAISRLGGWANRFVGGGAGLFIASMWAMVDESAYRFAEAFYEALLDGQTVAEATGLARKAAYAPGDPSWLAYTVYAHPNARLAKE